MRSFSTDQFGQWSHEKFIFLERGSEITILIFGKLSKIDENGLEWVRHGSPRAHIRRGRSYKLADAAGRPPDAPWGRFKAILTDFGVDKGSTEFSGFFPIYPFFGELPRYHPWWKLCA